MLENYFSIIQEELEKGRPLCEATIIEVEGTTPRGVGTSMVVKSNGETVGTIGGGGLEFTIIKKALEFIKCQQCGIEEVLSYKNNNPKEEVISRVRVFLKTYLPKDRIIIFGAGHVGTALYKHAILTNFSVILLDDRPGFLSPEKYPHALDLIGDTVYEGIDENLITANSYVMIASSSHKSDEEILKRVLSYPCKYIGMLGSKGKAQSIFNNLLQEGIDKEQLNKVFSPAGLKIGGQSPEEVALSIMAEMVSIKNGHQQDVYHMKFFEK